VCGRGRAPAASTRAARRARAGRPKRDAVLTVRPHTAGNTSRRPSSPPPAVPAAPPGTARAPRSPPRLAATGRSRRRGGGEADKSRLCRCRQRHRPTRGLGGAPDRRGGGGLAAGGRTRRGRPPVPTVATARGRRGPVAPTLWRFGRGSNQNSSAHARLDPGHALIARDSRGARAVRKGPGRGNLRATGRRIADRAVEGSREVTQLPFMP